MPFDLLLNLSQISLYSTAISMRGGRTAASDHAQGSAGSGATASNARKSTIVCFLGAGPTATSDSSAVRSIMISGSGGSGGPIGLARSARGGAGRCPTVTGAPSGAGGGASPSRVTSPPNGPCPRSRVPASGLCRRKKLEGKLAMCTWRLDDRMMAPIPTAHTAKMDHTRQSVTTPIACDNRPLTATSSAVDVSTLRQLLHHTIEHIEARRTLPDSFDSRKASSNMIFAVMGHRDTVPIASPGRLDSPV